MEIRSIQNYPLFLVMAALAISTGCAMDVDDSESAPEQRDEAIKGGIDANAYPESVLIDFTLTSGPVVGTAQCSGTLIAPKVVLTAAHCVVHGAGFLVRAPYVKATSMAMSTAMAPGYVESDPTTPDVALLFLGIPIKLAAFPKIATTQSPNGSPVALIGRVKDGAISSTQLFVRSPVTLLHGDAEGVPSLYYAKTDIAEHGDSGGPVIATGSNPHQIVAVNQAIAQDSETLEVVNIFARIDKASGWITQQVAAHP